MQVGKIQLRQCRSDSLVAFLHRTLAKQRLILAATGRVDREQHQAGRQSVDAVDRHQVRIAGALDQACQQGLLDVLTGRHHR